MIPLNELHERIEEANPWFMSVGKLNGQIINVHTFDGSLTGINVGR